MSFSEIFEQKFETAIDQYAALKQSSQDQLNPEKNEKFKKAMRIHLQNNYSLVQENMPQIEEFVKNFGDEKSLDVFAQEMCYHIFALWDLNFACDVVSPLNHTNYFNLLKQKKAENQDKFPVLFFPSKDDAKSQLVPTFMLRQYAYDLPEGESKGFKVEPNEVVLNCGACMGDSSIWFYKEGAAKVYSFEPMPIAFKYLTTNLQLFNYPQEYAFQLCVSDKVEEQTFVEFVKHLGASREMTPRLEDVFVKNKVKDVNVVKARSVVLDDWLEENQIKPTLIKMDLEGAEYNALKGLQKTITKDKPKLAVCLYHSMEDMWRLPALIHSFNPDYTFYCKKSQVSCEFVLFAV